MSGVWKAQSDNWEGKNGVENGARVEVVTKGHTLNIRYIALS